MKKGISVYALAGGLFTGVGSLFTVLGLLMVLNFRSLAAHAEGNVILLPVCFLGLGLISLVVGLVLLYTHIASVRQKRRLIEQGHFIWADIAGFPMDYSVTINGMPMFRILARYQDPITGQVYEFASDPIRYDPSPYVISQKIKVFVDKGTNFHIYTVDISSAWPNYPG